ncbi:MAG: hypothetical protein JXX29_12420 [Deltaproteobacteria bacterium]|nr:hypothetical protein [Deltaproteobacteria bacterium]MBN2672479.1 hypothetical protein [Deltaproteobacteria bacterium]
MSLSSIGNSFHLPSTVSFVRPQTSSATESASSTAELSPELSSKPALEPPPETASAQENDKMSGEELSDDDQREVDRLQRRDVEVRAHEAAHLAAAGQYAQGGASFDFERGPDGKQYAVGGDVSISVSEAQTPEATIAKMQLVRRAALAPASPSSQDRRVASEATQKEAQAKREMIAENADTLSPEDGADSSEMREGLAGITRNAREKAAVTGYRQSEQSASANTRSMSWAI